MEKLEPFSGHSAPEAVKFSMLRVMLAGLLLLLPAPSSALADTFQHGLAAYERGDYALALNILQPLARKGDARAQNDLAVMYRKGHDVRRNNAAAAALFLLSAQQGYARAQNNLAVMYRKGEGVPQNYTSAALWSLRAAEQGHARAQNNLAVMYLHGQGVPQDHAAAVKWFRKAARQGYPRAQKNLRMILEVGRGADVAAAPSPSALSQSPTQITSAPLSQEGPETVSAEKS